MDPTLLTQIIEASKANASTQNPYGYTYVPIAKGEALDMLAAGKMVDKGSTSQDGQSWAVRPTEQAVKWHLSTLQEPHMPQAEVAQRQSQPAPIAQQPVAQPNVGSVKLDDNVPLPTTQRTFGRQSDTPSLLDAYPFAYMEVQQSFFLPQDNPPKVDAEGKVVPKHRAFSSVVSNANKKFHPKAFKVFEENNGARIYRVADMTGPRPTRTRNKPSASQVQPGAPVASYPAPGTFAAPQPVAMPGFAQPQPGPGMFGGGAPQGFGPGPAPAWSPQDNPAPFAGPGFQNTGGAAAMGQAPAFQAPSEWAPGFGGVSDDAE